MKEAEIFRRMYEESSAVVFFGGAGVSTESGIPDFRSEDGLYKTKWKYPPETILSRSFFLSHPAEFYEFYREKLVVKGAKPNACHLSLKRMEEEGKLKALITQNIDSLHQKAGSKNVLELHGSTAECKCTKCGAHFDGKRLEGGEEIPVCECTGILRPCITLYEEPLKQQVIEESVRAISEADMLIIGGTSLVVYPAASFINYFHGKYLVLINRSPTQADGIASLIVRERIASFFTAVFKLQDVNRISALNQ